MPFKFPYLLYVGEDGTASVLNHLSPFSSKAEADTAVAWQKIGQGQFDDTRIAKPAKARQWMVDSAGNMVPICQAPLTPTAFKAFCDKVWGEC